LKEVLNFTDEEIAVILSSIYSKTTNEVNDIINNKNNNFEILNKAAHQILQKRVSDEAISSEQTTELLVELMLIRHLAKK